MVKKIVIWAVGLTAIALIGSQMPNIFVSAVVGFFGGAVLFLVTNLLED